MAGFRRRQEREPTPDEIRAAVPAPPTPNSRGATDPSDRHDNPPLGHCTQVWTDEHGVRRREVVSYLGETPKLKPDTHVEYDGEPEPDYD